MPPLPTPGHPPAILAHVLFPFQPAVVASLQDENFLLVKSCVISADYDIERRVNPSTGQCYAKIYSNFQMNYAMTADVTANFGLANWHPGAQVGPGVRQGISVGTSLGFANAQDCFGVKGGVFIYESPRRTNRPGVLPEISFNVARENADLDTSQLAVPAVEAVTSISYPPTAPPPTGARYDLIYNISTVWLRRVTLVGPVTGLTHLSDEPFYYKLPASVKAPATMSAFLAMAEALPAEVTDENEIEEVITTTASGVSVLRAGSSLIPPFLAAGGGLPANIGYNFFWGGNAPGTGYFTNSAISNATTAAEFIAQQQAPGDAPGHIGNAEVVEVYSLKAGQWLTV